MSVSLAFIRIKVVDILCSPEQDMAGIHLCTLEAGAHTFPQVRTAAHSHLGSEPKWEFQVSNTF